MSKIIKVWDNKYNRMEDAELLNIRYNVKSILGYIYPKLYDVRFLHDNRVSNGHLEHAVIQ